MTPHESESRNAIAAVGALHKGDAASCAEVLNLIDDPYAYIAAVQRLCLSMLQVIDSYAIAIEGFGGPRAADTNAGALIDTLRLHAAQA